MNNVKLHLKEDQCYIGGREYGQVKENIEAVILGLLNGTIKIPKSDTQNHETLMCRIDDETLKKLGKLAQFHGINMQELLRIGLVQSNLVAQIK